jgi:hypothetical protein
MLNRSSTSGQIGNEFWHQAVRCAGIKYCEKIHQDLIEEQKRWNSGFQPEQIGVIRTLLNGIKLNPEIDEEHKKETEE